MGLTPTTQKSGQFAVHTAEYNITNAGWDQLRAFYDALQKRSPYISIERFILSSGTNPAVLTLNLKIVSVEIAPGEMVAFIGPSGTGKSTLLGLVMRFQDPTGGSLALDGVDYRDIRLRDLRGHMAYVAQDTVLLPATIAANIALKFPESAGLNVNRLIATGLVLFFVTFIVNALARRIANAGFSGADG